jgi:hypothetical protein
VPNFSQLIPSFVSQFIGKERGEPLLPIPYRLVGELKTSYQKIFGHVPIAHLIADSAQENLKENVGGDFDEVEGGSGALVEGLTTIAAAMGGVAQIRGTFTGYCIA